MIRLFTRAQNSKSVCQSRPLRARREASIANTAPAAPGTDGGQQALKARPCYSAAGTTKVLVNDDHVLPAKLPRAGRERVLATAALRIVDELVRSRLPHIDIGAAQQVIRRDLIHCPPPSLLPCRPRTR